MSNVGACDFKVIGVIERALRVPSFTIISVFSGSRSNVRVTLGPYRVGGLEGNFVRLKNPRCGGRCRPWVEQPGSILPVWRFPLIKENFLERLFWRRPPG